MGTRIPLLLTPLLLAACAGAPDYDRFEHVPPPEREPPLAITPGEAAMFEYVGLYNRVVEALQRAPQVEADDISVAVSGTTVYLSGSVPDLAQIARARRVVAGVEGVERVVDDRLRVQ